MGDRSQIEWTDATWNPITGCTYVSEGCANCYAARLAATRLRHHPTRSGLVDSHGNWTGETRFNEEVLEQPLRWQRPRRIFVVAHGDIFHESVPDEWIDSIFAVIGLCPQHVFQVLTKRPYRMYSYIRFEPVYPHVHLGVSAEHQDAFDERAKILSRTPAAVRWLSLDPLLGPIRMPFPAAFDWVVVGGESGPNARPMKPAWARFLRDQCASHDVPFHFKQWGGRTAKAGGRLLDGEIHDAFPKAVR